MQEITGIGEQDFTSKSLSLSQAYSKFLYFKKGEKITILQKDFERDGLVEGKNEKGQKGLVYLPYLKFQQTEDRLYSEKSFDELYKIEQQIVPKKIQITIYQILQKLYFKGIFRTEGSSEEVKHFLYSDTNLQENYPFEVYASAFKKFYKDQMENYGKSYFGDTVEKLIRVYNQQDLTEQEKLEQYADCICTIPNQFMFINFRVILMILSKVHEHSTDNLMSSENLARIFVIWLLGSVSNQLLLRQLIENQQQLEQLLNQQYPLDFNDDEIFSKSLEQLNWKQKYGQYFKKQQAFLKTDIYSTSGSFISGPKGREIQLINEEGDYYIAEIEGLQGYIYKNDVIVK